VGLWAPTILNLGTDPVRRRLASRRAGAASGSGLHPLGGPVHPSAGR
jgi:hypothetical protein